MSPKKVKMLADKKYRAETGLFIVEGEKNILELLGSDFLVETILGTKQFFGALAPSIRLYEQSHGQPLDLQEVDEDTLIKSGTLVSNNAGIAVVKQKASSTVGEIITQAQGNIVLILDDVRDPGNMGTIIRTANWYGVSHIVASPSTTDFYNAKVISATMGSFTRVSVTYLELTNILTEAQKLHVPVIVADLQGKNIHEGGLPKNGFLLMGSESHGVSETALHFATHTATIPRFGNAESLNVSVATGIFLDTLRRS